jgi:hypothetical protein
MLKLMFLPMIGRREESVQVAVVPAEVIGSRREVGA